MRAAVDTRVSRRSALRSIGAGTLGALTAWAGQAGGTPLSKEAAAVPIRQRDTRPSIILIVLDDLRADDLAMMPEVQALLVAQGASFANFFVTTPGCSPARASILRGQYPHTHGVLRSDGRFGGFERFFALGHERSTVATWLQDAGYRTALIGKYLNGYRSDTFPDGGSATYVPPGWDDWVGVTREPYFKLETNENGRLVQYEGEAEYSTDVLATKALTFVERMARRARPSFLYLAPRAPHWPADAAPRHTTAFTQASAPRTPSFNEIDVSDKPAWVNAIRPLGEKRIKELDASHVARLRTLLAVDEMVAALVETLERAGSLESTYILLTSDNGYHLGEHRIAEAKGSPYEEAIRVPLVVRGPGVAAGQTIAALGSQVDLAPTLAAWANAAVPGFAEGRSLAPLLAGEAPPAWRQTVLIEKHLEREAGSAKRPGFEALRGEGYLYVENFTGERELYNLGEDPFQLDNRVSAADPGQIAALSEQLAAMTECTGEVCREIEATPLPIGVTPAQPGDAVVQAESTAGQ